MPNKRRPRASSRPWALITVLAVITAVNLAGAPYFILTRGERVRSALHPWFKPSGYVGQSAGLLAFAMIIFIWLYPLRKKFRWLAFTGSLARWLDVHILAGFALPLLVALHASWRFDGLIGLGYAAILIVCASGLIGKYLYVRIPRSKAGLELDLDEIQNQRRSLVTRIAGTIGLPVDAVERDLAAALPGRREMGFFASLIALVSNDLARWRTGFRLRRRWSKLMQARPAFDKKVLSEAVALASRQISLSQQVRMLQATQRVFRFWHVAHRPFAITALVAVIIHVVVMIVLGVTWF